MFKYKKLCFHNTVYLNVYFWTFYYIIYIDYKCILFVFYKLDDRIQTMLSIERNLFWMQNIPLIRVYRFQFQKNTEKKLCSNTIAQVHLFDQMFSII